MLAAQVRRLAGQRHVRVRLSLSRWQTRCASSKSSRSSTDIVVRSPPVQLKPGFFERPTPVLFLPWECRGVNHWLPHMDYLAERGITSAAFNFQADGLQAMEDRTVSVISELGFTPPVIIARSVGTFVAQKYLQSHGASGMVLIDPFPPFPSQMATHLASEALDCEAAEARRAMWADPGASEPALRSMFAEAVRDEWFTAAEELQLGTEAAAAGWRAARGYTSDEAPFAFPVKAFAEMMHPDTCIKLEPGSVNMLVVSTGMSDLASIEIAMETTSFHGAVMTWCRNSAGAMSTVYAWYDKGF